MKSYFAAVFAGALLLCASLAHSDAASAVAELQRDWAEANYEQQGQQQQQAFASVAAQAQKYRDLYPDSAEVLIWNGIIKASYAGARGGLKALGLAKAAKADLERALVLDRDALEGSALTSLGTLYYKVPGWPLGFGDKDKAQALLEAALAIDPDGIDANYFYGCLLLDQRQFQTAKRHLETARAAPARPGRALADRGRQREIGEALAELQRHLQ